MKNLKNYMMLILLLVSILLVACNSNNNESNENSNNGDNNDATVGNSDSDKLFFTYANVTESGPLFVQLGKGVKAAAEKAGIELKMYNNDFDAQTTLNNAKLMIQDNPDLIIEYNIVEGLDKTLSQEFSASGIPSIAVNLPIPDSYLFNLSNQDMGYDTGKVVAEIANERGWKSDDITVIIAQNATSGYEVNNSVRYFYISVAEELGLEKVEPEEIMPTTTTIGDHLIQVDGKSELEPTYTAVKNVIQTLPEDRKILLFTVNDDSSLGAWRAIEESGREDNALVAGIGGSEESLKQLRENPNWVAEGSIFMEDWGQYLIAMGVAIVNGVEPPELTLAPQVVLTKENVNDYYGEGTTAINLPPLVEENKYLEDTGILQLFENIEGLK